MNMHSNTHTQMHTHTNIHTNTHIYIFIAQSAGAVEYTDECPGYDTKHSDGEVLAVLELWGMWSTPLLSSLPGPLWPGVVAPDRALSIG